MRADVAYDGGLVSNDRVNADAVRDGIYTAAMGLPQLGGHVAVSLFPTARDARGVASPASCTRALEAAIDGLLAAKVLRDKRDVVQVTIHAFAVGSGDGMRLALEDVSEPF